MFEHRNTPPISILGFAHRLLKGLGIVLIIIGISLLIGMKGYHDTEGLSWIDSLLNASMILGGMGPVDIIKTDEGKYFASFYAIYSGIIIIGVATILLAPIIHRILHKMHYINPENRNRNFRPRRRNFSSRPQENTRVNRTENRRPPAD